MTPQDLDNWANWTIETQVQDTTREQSSQPSITEQTKSSIDELFPTQQQEQNNSWTLTLTTKSWEITVPYTNSWVDFIKNNPDSVDFDYIKQLFSEYDWSFKSIDQIFEELKENDLKD